MAAPKAPTVSRETTAKKPPVKTAPKQTPARDGLAAYAKSTRFIGG